MKVQLPRRRLIPRWRRVATTLELPEGTPAASRKSGSPIAGDTQELEVAISEWRSNPTLGHLGDILAHSVADDLKDEVKKVAAEVRAKGLPTTFAQEEIIKRLLSDEESSQVVPTSGCEVCNPHVRQQTRELRSILRLNPANPLALLDLAQFQLASGNVKDAERSLLTANHLSHNNRLVLRTLARFYVHSGSPDKAHSLLVRSARTRTDPWLMAGEIAVSQAAGIPSRFASVGSKIALQTGNSRKEVTELAGAVGGLELANGRWKRARELFRVALLSPNDNVIAQAITDQKDLMLNIDTLTQRRAASRAVEARALLAWQAMDAEAAEAAAFKWHAEEPFSSRPLHVLTALSAVASKYENLVGLARRGLVANPDDAVLMANLAYGLASLDRLPEARSAIQKARSLDPKAVGAQVTATSGLIALKELRFEMADALYGDAIDQFRAAKRDDMVAACYAYYARAACHAGHPRATDILDSAVRSYLEAPSVDAALVLRSIGRDVKEPKPDENMRRLSQWIYNERTNTLTLEQKVTNPGAPALRIKSE
mgnify:CR=1 FL=1|jgi:hypothetical protein